MSKDGNFLMKRDWDETDEEMAKQAEAIRRVRQIAGNVATNGIGSRTLRCRMAHKRQAVATGSRILRNAEEKTGLSHEL